MNELTTEQQLENVQQYHRLEALRQAREYCTQQCRELDETALLKSADKFYQFIKSGLPKEGEGA